MQWMLLPYRRYFDFSGRSRRMEFWMFLVFVWLVEIVISLVFGFRSFLALPGGGGVTNTLSGVGGAIYALFGLFSFIPHISVSVRRLHDQDRSGWLLLLILLPILGWFALLVLFFLSGTPGPNRYGPDPKNPYDIDAFS